jgi:Helix-turn-helix domain
VSVEAVSWALNLAPVPADRGGQPSSACKFVLVGLANHAGPDGAGAFPSVATLVRYTGLSERTVRTCLDRLEAARIVSPCDPGIVAARIKRADRRPQGWNLNLTLVRDDLGDAAIAALEHQFPGLGMRLTAAAPPGADGQADGVQPPHPESSDDEAVDNRPHGVQQLHLEPGAGCNHDIDGVQPAHERGAAVAPEPSKEPSMEPSAASAHARQVTATPGTAGGGQAVGEFFAVLGDGWRLTADQRARLAPAVQAALDAGWLPPALAAFAGANTAGVRNPYAVLAARLSPAELPPQQRQRPALPPWCGQCDEVTRMLGFDGDAPRRCPRCKPWVAASHAARRHDRPLSRAASSQFVERDIPTSGRAYGRCRAMPRTGAGSHSWGECRLPSASRRVRTVSSQLVLIMTGVPSSGSATLTAFTQ